MPINDPIKRGKVAPGSLAFERRRSGGGASIISQDGATGDTYQTVINLTYAPRFNVTVVDKESRERDARMHRVVTSAEQRAKHHVSDWHMAVEYDCGTRDFTWQTNAGGINFLDWPREVIRSMGAGYESNGAWSFRVPANGTGDWWFYAAWMGIFISANQIEAAALRIYRNDNLWRVLDVYNHDMSKHTTIRTTVVKGGCIVPLAAGDRVYFALELIGAAGAGTLASGPSFYSYVSGHRVSCDPTIINTSASGDDFDIQP